MNPAGPDGSRSGNPVPADDVAAMFDDIAPVYDRLNTVMTLGLDGHWRRLAVDTTGLADGEAVIDVACGTGKLAGLLAGRVGPFGRVLAVDLSPAMVEAARANHSDLVQLEFRVGDALALAAPDDAFDAATIAFGLRNLADFEAGFRELARVVRPGGRVVCLELSVPRPRAWGRVFLATFRRVAPLIGAAFGQLDAYRYLPTSLDGFPDADEIARTMRRVGLVDVGYRRLALGAVALHRGTV
ncbi:MAG: ubiquinone/menaquinone biosynthesis methyltransferase, partial [Candidatus Limnocylindrales bacterium]